MNFAVRFYRDKDTTLQDIMSFDEIIIDYLKKDVSLINFINETMLEGKRLVLDITNYSDENFNLLENKEILTAAKEACVKKSITFFICLSENQINNEDFIAFLSSIEVPFFCYNIITNLEDFIFFLSKGVSQIYVGGDLGFSLLDIHEAYPNIGLRVYPNIAQTKNSPKITGFFIRPEDIVQYSNLPITFEFFGSRTKQKILYQIYKKGVWKEDLRSIILGLEEPLIGNCLPSYFGVVRSTCKKNCALKKCTFCTEIQKISNKMTDRNLSFQYKN